MSNRIKITDEVSMDIGELLSSDLWLSFFELVFYLISILIIIVAVFKLHKNRPSKGTMQLLMRSVIYLSLTILVTIMTFIYSEDIPHFIYIIYKFSSLFLAIIFMFCSIGLYRFVSGLLVERK